MASSSSVYLYRYDLSGGMARSLAPLVLGRPLEAIWHTSIVVFGIEFYYENGTSIGQGAPGSTHYGTPVRKELLGETTLSKEEFLKWVEERKASDFGPTNYNVLEHNCNDFSEAAAQFLVGKSIPLDVRTMVPEVMASPIGKIVMGALQGGRTV